MQRRRACRGHVPLGRISSYYQAPPIGPPSARAGRGATEQKTRVTTVKKIEQAAAGGTECLVQVHGPNVGKRYELTESVITIGRDEDNAIHLESDSVSRRHARIELLGTDRFVVDLGSTNGSYLNDKPVVRERLAHGDFLQIGDTIFKYLAGKDLESAYFEVIHATMISDGLTRVANKRHFLEFLDREWSRSRRHERSLALLMMDIDLFKRVNDDYGHIVGDHVLRDVAGVIRARMRKEEMVARYGGEEFAIVLPETDIRGAVTFAEALRKLIAGHSFEFEGQRIPVTVSVGAAIATAEMRSPDELVKAADERLYEAKRAGRNRVSPAPAAPSPA